MSLPRQPLLQRQHLRIGEPAVLVALQPHALAPRHLRHLRQRKDHQFAVLAHDRHMVALGGHQQFRGETLVGAHHTPALARRAHQIILADDKTPPIRRRRQHFSPGLVGKHQHDVRPLVEIGQQPDRLAEAPPARQSCRLDREHLSVRGQHQQFCARVGEEGGREGIVALVGQRPQFGHMPLERANPAFSRDDHRHRLTFDQRFREIGFRRRRAPRRRSCGGGQVLSPARRPSSGPGSAR